MILKSKVMTENIKLAIELLQIALKNPNGFTVTLDGQFVKSGYVSAVEDTQNAFDLSGLERVIECSRARNLYIGGWLNSKNDQFYWDSCQVFSDKQEAIQFGLDNNQIAIFDLNKYEEILLSQYQNQAA